MKTFKIYFNDLNEDAQKRLLKEAKVDNPKDVNWFLDIYPIAFLMYEDEEEEKE